MTELNQKSQELLPNAEVDLGDEDDAAMTASGARGYLTPTGSSGVPVTPDEIYSEIDRVREQIHETPPGLLARLTSANARKRADALEEAHLEQIQSRTAFIKGMRRVIDIYIQTHVEDIKLRQKHYLIPRITGLLDQLNERTVQSSVQVLRIYQAAVDEIGAIPGLPPQIRARQIEAAYARAEKKQAVIDGQLDGMIEDIARTMREIVAG